MPIDPNIAMGYRPPQFESPVNQMAAVMQLQGAQQANELNRQKMEEYARAREMEGMRRNALAGVDFNAPDSFNKVAQRLYDIGDLKGADEMLKARDERDYKQAQATHEKAKASKAETETRAEKLKYVTLQLPILAQNPTDAAVEEMAANLFKNGVLSYEQANASAQQIKALPMEQRSQKIMQTALTAKDALKQHYMQVDSGDKTTIYAAPEYGTAAPRVVTEVKEGLSPYQQSKLSIDRYKASKEGNATEAPKLKQGERWNKELGRVEAVPGSDIFVKQSGAHGKDLQALQGVETKVDSAIAKIDYILSPENKSGFDANFGGYTSYAASRITGKGIDVRSNIESLKSDLKAAGLELMRSGGSIGQITEREWPIIEGMIGALKPEMTKDEAKKQFTKIKTYMENIRNNARNAYDAEWGETQYHKGAKTPAASAAPATGAPAVGTVKDGYKFKGGNPADAKSWEKI